MAISKLEKSVEEAVGLSIIIATLAERGSLMRSVESAFLSCAEVDKEIVIICPEDKISSLSGQLKGYFSESELIEILILPETRGGVYEAMNLGIQNSKYSHVLFLNDDDRLLPKSIDKIFSEIGTKLPDLIASANYLEFTCCGLWHPTFPESNLGSRIFNGGMSTCHQSQIWRRETLINLGGFRRQLKPRFPILGRMRTVKIACDFDLFTRAVISKISYIPNGTFLSIVDARGESGIAWRETYWNLNKVIWATFRPNLKWFPVFIHNVISSEIFHRNSTWVHNHEY